MTHKVKDALRDANSTLDGAEHDMAYARLDYLATAVEDFISELESHDNWRAVYTGDPEPQPGFTLEELRELLGYDKDGD